MHSTTFICPERAPTAGFVGQVTSETLLSALTAFI